MSKHCRSLPVFLALGACLPFMVTAHAAPTSNKTVSEEAPREIVIDSVVASVDDKPITLSELGNRMIPPRKLTLEEAGKDQTALMALDALIMEKLIEAEASSKRMYASDAEIEEYVQEVARRNGLSRTEFEAALARQGQSLKGYQQQIKIDILKTKLASNISRGGVSISESEINEYLATNTNLRQADPAVKLRHILISAEGRSEEEVRERAKSVLAELEDGEEFASVAEEYSDGPHKNDGGLIGAVAEKDLSAEVRQAVADLKVGSFSAPIEDEKGVQIFFLEDRFAGQDENEESDAASSEARRAEARRVLQEQKAQSRLSSYFAGELYKNHAVDKKL